MTNENFFYWLQGAFEIGEICTITKSRASTILKHIELVAASEGTNRNFISN